MRLEINRKDSYNCLQNLVSAVAHYYHVDYRMMMLELWGFEYNKYKGNFGERVGLFWSGKLNYRNRLLADFHGIVLEYYKNLSDISNLKDVVKSMPVAFYVDSYDCEWLPFYQKQHRSHLCNIVEMDTENCYCQDEYWNNEPYKMLRIDELEKKASDILLIYKKEERETPIENIQERILEATKRYEDCGCLDKMELFIEDFPEEIDLALEIVNNDPVSSKIIMYLRCLGDDKKNLIEFFEYIHEKVGFEVDEVIHMLNEQSKRWYMIRNYLIKLFYTSKNIDRNLLKKELRYIYIYEKKIYQFMSLFCNK